MKINTSKCTSKCQAKPQKQIKSNKSAIKLKRKAKLYYHVLIKLLCTMHIPIYNDPMKKTARRYAVRSKIWSRLRSALRQREKDKENCKWYDMWPSCGDFCFLFHTNSTFSTHARIVEVFRCIINNCCMLNLSALHIYVPIFIICYNEGFCLGAKFAIKTVIIIACQTIPHTFLPTNSLIRFFFKARPSNSTLYFHPALSKQASMKIKSVNVIASVYVI